MKYDFAGWATKNNLLCSDGRTILKDAFKENDGKTVPIVWNHQHDSPLNVLGHALLQNREEGVYAYCKLNDTEQGQVAKQLVDNGDVNSLSIYAGNLAHQGLKVVHGDIKEVSLVLAGANPGALIDYVLSHGELSEEAAVIYSFMDDGKSYIDVSHGEIMEAVGDSNNSTIAADATEEGEVLAMADNETANDNNDDEKTVGERATEILNKLSDEDQKVIYSVIGMALTEGDDDAVDNDKNKDEEEETVKHNVFDTEDQQNEKKSFLSHADQEAILLSAKQSNVGSLQAAIRTFVDSSNSLQHAFDDDEIDVLFPDYRDIRPGAPEIISRDQGWVTVVMNKVHKSPFSRIRTRQADIRGTDIRGYGYIKGNEKELIGNTKLLSRTTDPQTVYVKDALNRDDILDITSFDVVQYQYGIMKQTLNEEIALAIMVGDGREDGDTQKIDETHIRPIWTDDDVYTLHVDVDIESATEELNGTNTSGYFGENYIYAEAIIQAALYAKEDYKGTGTPDFFCTPHILNVMLLARDLNGRRIYDSKADLAKALNVGDIYTAEQFEGLTRTDDDGNTKELLGLFVNLSDYVLGATKGGEITSFQQFDIDFNLQKYLIETRLSGAMTRAYSAIALELPVEETTE